MGVLDSLEQKVKALEKVKQNLEQKKDVLKGEIQGDKTFWQAFKEGYFLRKRKKPGIILRTATQMVLFFINFAIFNYLLDIFGWEETIFLLLIAILTIAGYIGYNQTQGR